MVPLKTEFQEVILNDFISLDKSNTIKWPRYKSPGDIPLRVSGGERVTPGVRGGVHHETR